MIAGKTFVKNEFINQLKHNIMIAGKTKTAKQLAVRSIMIDYNNYECRKNKFSTLYIAVSFYVS